VGILANYASRMSFLSIFGGPWTGKNPEKPIFIPFLPIWELIVNETDEI
jgi:hypothetical protein